MLFIDNYKKDQDWALVSESSVSQIYFELASILKNRSSNFRGLLYLPSNTVPNIDSPPFPLP